MANTVTTQLSGGTRGCVWEADGDHDSGPWHDEARHEELQNYGAGLWDAREGQMKMQLTRKTI